MLILETVDMQDMNTQSEPDETPRAAGDGYLRALLRRLPLPLIVLTLGICVFMLLVATRPETKPVENRERVWNCLLYTSPSPRDLSTSRMPSSA